MSEIPTKESKHSGIPVTDVESAQKALLRQAQIRKNEQPENVETETETQEEVSAEAMEDAESVENEADDSVELTADDLLDDDTTTQVGEPKTYTVKVNGKDVEVTEEELVQGYSRTADYSEKTQILSEQRKDTEKSQQEAKALRARLESEVQATQQERAQYISQLEELESSSNQQLKAFEGTDWNKLKQDDPYDYMSKRDQYRELQESRRVVQAKKQEAIAKQQQESLKIFEQQKAENYKLLVERLPEWADAEKGPILKRQIKEYAIQKGFSDNEIGMMIDARSIDVLDKAMRYERLLAAKIAANTKKAKVAPKVQKPGTPTTSSERNSDKVKQYQARLKKTGKVTDAASAIQASSLLS